MGWAVAFVLHLIAMMGVIATNWSSGDGSSMSSLHGTIFLLVGVTGLSAVALSIGALSFMMQKAEILVQTALVFSVFTSLVVAVLGFMTGSVLMGCLGLFSFCVGLCYMKVVWNRIPFAAVNSATALACVQRNLGLSAVSLMFTVVAFGWTLLWFFGVGSALENSNSVILFFLVSTCRCSSQHFR